MVKSSKIESTYGQASMGWQVEFRARDRDLTLSAVLSYSSTQPTLKRG